MHVARKPLGMALAEVSPTCIQFNMQFELNFERKNMELLNSPEMRQMRNREYGELSFKKSRLPSTAVDDIRIFLTRA